MGEANFEKRCVEHAQSKGWFVCKIACPGTKGMPDRLFIKEGVVIFIEFKDPDSENKLSRMQAAQIRKLRKAGVEAYWCADWDMFLEILNHGLTAEAQPV